MSRPSLAPPVLGSNGSITIADALRAGLAIS
jgi:hypothetical protein